MRARSIVLVAALLVAVPAAPGHAGGCPLITDARGDARPLFYDSTPADDALGAGGTDILAADAWTDSTHVNAVIRVAELPEAPLVPRTHGYQWELRLQAEGGTITLLATENNGNWGYNSTWETLVGADGTGTAAASTVNLYSTSGTRDAKRGEIRLATPLPVFAPYTKVGKGVRWMPSVWSFVMNGAPSAAAAGIYQAPFAVGSQSDSADGKRPVTIGRPECTR